MEGTYPGLAEDRSDTTYQSIDVDHAVGYDHNHPQYPFNGNTTVPPRLFNVSPQFPLPATHPIKSSPLSASEWERIFEQMLHGNGDLHNTGDFDSMPEDPRQIIDIQESFWEMLDGSYTDFSQSEYQNPYVDRPPNDKLPNHQLEDISSQLRLQAAQSIQRILRDKELYKLFLRLNKTDAQIALNVFQKLLDEPTLGNNLRAPFLKAMLRLSSQSGLYPQCLTLRDIWVDQRAVTAGHFGEIWLGRFRNQKVCLKVIKLYDRSQIQHLLRRFICEAIVWSRLTHPNLLPFYGIYHLEDTSDRVCLVSPWMENGNIKEYLSKNPAAPKLALIHDIAEGLEYLHENGIVHGDLKGLNILVNPCGIACLTDFGLSTVMDADILRWTSLETSAQVGGTVRWAAPEILHEEDQSVAQMTFASDIWSFGSVLYEVFTGQVPFYEFPRDPAVIYQRIMGKLPTRPPQGMALELTDEIWDVMEECWKQNPKERPRVHEILSRLPKVPNRSSIHPKHDVKEGLAKTVLTFRNCMHGQDSLVTPEDVNVLTRISGDMY